MNLLFDLTLRGSLALLLVAGLDRWSGRVMKASGRRWWWSIVALGFLLPVRLSVLPPATRALIPQSWDQFVPGYDSGPDVLPVPIARHFFPGSFWLWPWLGGAVIYLFLVVKQTIVVGRRWSRERPSTDPRLLELLEDCKESAGVTAPIGLILSDNISAPVILGWLRPRILLPTALASSMSRDGLRAVLFHELAHFKSCDIPLNWLFTLVRVLHWFNPLAYLASAMAIRFQDEAADEAAMRWMQEPCRDSYGESLLLALRHTHRAGPPFGALALGESIQNLKRRITMINRYEKKTPRLILAMAVSGLLAALIAVQPTRAADEGSGTVKAAAVAAIQNWLGEIDGTQYAKSWQDAAPYFQQKVTQEAWVAKLEGARSPLGKCSERKLVSCALFPADSSKTFKNEYVITQFDASFENQKYSIETVVFIHEDDGTWKAVGYRLKPKI
jgi:beta-lactamase regulating signal transducer with metallopeptidase domain